MRLLVGIGGWGLVAALGRGVTLALLHLAFQLFLHCFPGTLLLGQGCMHKEGWVGFRGLSAVDGVQGWCRDLHSWATLLLVSLRSCMCGVVAHQRVECAHALSLIHTQTHTHTTHKHTHTHYTHTPHTHAHTPHTHAPHAAAAAGPC